jgi:hypothetical protein
MPLIVRVNQLVQLEKHQTGIPQMPPQSNANIRAFVGFLQYRNEVWSAMAARTIVEVLKRVAGGVLRCFRIPFDAGDRLRDADCQTASDKQHSPDMEREWNAPLAAISFCNKVMLLQWGNVGLLALS